MKTRAAIALLLVVACSSALYTWAGNPNQSPPAPSPHSGYGTVALFFQGEALANSSHTPRLFVDDMFVGNTLPMQMMEVRFNLSPGKHDIRVELDGYKPFASSIFILGYKTEQTLSVNLVSAK